MKIKIMKKFFKLILSLFLIVTIYDLFFLFLLSPVKAMEGGYCIMRSTLTISSEERWIFGFQRDEDAIVIMGRETVGYPRNHITDKGNPIDHYTPMWGVICLLGTINFTTNIMFRVPTFLFIIPLI